MENTEQQSTPPPESPSDVKQKLEAEKLRAEIEAIRRPFYKATAFYTSISPVVLALLGFWFTYNSGWFDTQRKSIEADKKLLTVETIQLESRKKEQQGFIDQLKTDRTVLSNQIAQLNLDADALRLQLARLEQEKASLTNQIALLEKERGEIRTAKEFFESEAKFLPNSKLIGY